MADTREQEPFEALSAQFPQDLIQWRAQSLTRNNEKALALAYIESRPIMDRLDDLIGPENWQCDYRDAGSGKLACGIGILLNGEWVWKWDGAGSDDDKGDKGVFTDAFKRAAVKWGIGRYLYDMPKIWVPCETYTKNGKEYFSRFTDNPWDYVSGAPPKNSGYSGSSTGQGGAGPPAEQTALDMDAPLRFGKKHKDTPTREVPNDYIQWMLENAKVPKWRQLAQRILDARKMDQSPKVEEENVSQDQDTHAANKILVPELSVFEQHLKPAAWMALLGERYSISQQLTPGTSPISMLNKQDQEDLLAYLQAEGQTRGLYVRDVETGKEVINAMFPNSAYRTLRATDMAALGPILEAHWKISQARESISGARLIIQGFESKERCSIYMAPLLKLRELLEAINGQAEPGDMGKEPEDDIPF